ncbi:unnamed protein product [Porites evermanni]|uniref:Uncharacterized protein n=1 Tax=Porites evermanni TaxID=104178 RepID=A0ABN8LYT6_9CNID|nr:unnamed protein product [Porites evermanni]
MTPRTRVPPISTQPRDPSASTRQKLAPSQKTEETRFAQLNDDKLDDLVEGAQAKSTKYATNYAVSVLKGNFSVKILL